MISVSCSVSVGFVVVACTEEGELRLGQITLVINVHSAVATPDMKYSKRCDSSALFLRWSDGHNYSSNVSMLWVLRCSERQ